MIHDGPLWITKTDLFKHTCDNTIKFRKQLENHYTLGNTYKVAGEQDEPS